MIAGIAISSAAFAMDKPYSYRVPEGMSLSPGQRVTVPFGRGNIRTEGIVLSLTEGEEAGLKAVERPCGSGTSVPFTMRSGLCCRPFSGFRKPKR